MRRLFLFLAICVAVMLVAASPVAATGTATTGTRISLFAAPATFAADAPFFVEHGTVCDASAGDQASDCMNANTHFDLYVDGVLEPSMVVIEDSPMLWVKLNLTNFAGGLPAGRHTLVGQWFQGGSVYFTLSARITFK